MSSRIDQKRFVKDSIQKIWSDMVCLSTPFTSCFLKAVFYKFDFVNSWIHCLIYGWAFSKNSYQKRFPQKSSAIDVKQAPLGIAYFIKFLKYQQVEWQKSGSTFSSLNFSFLFFIYRTFDTEAIITDNSRNVTFNVVSIEISK